ncbi:MAG: preprotein translocase subunit YajC [Myxococcales bacterium]
MQPEATSSAPAPGPSGAPAGGGAPPGCAGAGSQFAILGVMFAIFYFLLIRPQQKRQKEIDDMLKALRKGDKVRTTGGIRGEIVDLNETDATLLVADKVKINVLRSHIATRLDKNPEKTGDKGGEGKASS